MITSPTGLEKPRELPSGSRRRAGLGKLIGWGAVALSAFLAVILVMWSDRHPRSDNGKISAHVIGIAPRVSGPIRALPVQNNQLVRSGEVLFEIDPEPYLLAADVARANLDAINGEIGNAWRAIEAQRLQVRAAAGTLVQAETALAEATETYERLAPLLPKRYASPVQVDTARRARESAAAAVEVARAELASAEASVLDTSALESRQKAAAAALAQADLAVRDCTVRAPFEGRVAGMNLSPGAFARTAVDVMTFIDTRHWYVVAEFLESELRGIRPGDQAKVELMTAPGQAFAGEVESLGWGVTALPQDPFPGLPIVMKELDWVRLSQRFPVQIRLQETVPSDLLRVGASATATILPSSR
jgi:multidrug efflux system membrane fusion protein